MKRKRYWEEQIVKILRESDQGKRIRNWKEFKVFIRLSYEVKSKIFKKNEKRNTANKSCRSCIQRKSI